MWLPTNSRKKNPTGPERRRSPRRPCRKDIAFGSRGGKNAAADGARHGRAGLGVKVDCRDFRKRDAAFARRQREDEITVERRMCWPDGAHETVMGCHRQSLGGGLGEYRIGGDDGDGGVAACLRIELGANVTSVL